MDYEIVIVDQKETFESTGLIPPFSILIVDKETLETVVHLKEDDIVSIVLNYLLKTKSEIKLNIIENTSQEKKQSLKNKLYDLKSIKLFKLIEVEFK